MLRFLVPHTHTYEGSRPTSAVPHSNHQVNHSSIVKTMFQMEGIQLNSTEFFHLVLSFNPVSIENNEIEPIQGTMNACARKVGLVEIVNWRKLTMFQAHCLLMLNSKEVSPFFECDPIILKSKFLSKKKSRKLKICS